MTLNAIQGCFHVRYASCISFSVFAARVLFMQDTWNPRRFLRARGPCFPTSGHLFSKVKALSRRTCQYSDTVEVSVDGNIWEGICFKQKTLLSWSWIRESGMRPIVNYHASDCVLCIVNDSSSSFSVCFSSYYVHTGSNILTWWRWNMSFPEGSLAFVDMVIRCTSSFPTIQMTLGVRIHRILCLLKSQSTETYWKTSRLRQKMTEIERG